MLGYSVRSVRMMGKWAYESLDSNLRPRCFNRFDLTPIGGDFIHARETANASTTVCSHFAAMPQSCRALCPLCCCAPAFLGQAAAYRQAILGSSGPGSRPSAWAYMNVCTRVPSELLSSFIQPLVPVAHMESDEADLLWRQLKDTDTSAKRGHVRLCLEYLCWCFACLLDVEDGKL